MKMTKKLALNTFRSHDFYRLYVKNGDRVALREAWNSYTDAMCKNGTITEHQYNTWTNPF